VEGVNGLLVTPGSRQELAGALLRMAVDMDMVERMGEEGRLMAREYTWERVAEATERAYLRISVKAAAQR